MTTPLPGGPTREDEERELARLLERPEISRSANLVRLLTFVCARYFEGRSEEIRESAIAVEALGRRREGFDSQSDPIVRVTARTLRKRLDEFYRTEGRGHRVQLVLPTGQYVPRFLLADGHTAAPPDGGRDEEAAEEPPSSPAARVPGSWRRGMLVAGIATSLRAELLAGTANRAADEPRPQSINAWSRPAWSDEFDGPRGAPPDPDRWTGETGNNGGWGNRELEVYCAPGASAPVPLRPSPSDRLPGRRGQPRDPGGQDPRAAPGLRPA